LFLTMLRSGVTMILVDNTNALSNRTGKLPAEKTSISLIAIQLLHFITVPSKNPGSIQPYSMLNRLIVLK